MRAVANSRFSQRGTRALIVTTAEHPWPSRCIDITRCVQWLEHHKRLGVGRVYVIDHLSDVRPRLTA